jgi:kexin
VDNCYSGHGGTSAAAPLAAGIFALVLSARPELTWRDLQYLALDTAVPINTADEDWEKTSIGKLYNHKYGYGKLDAYAIVDAARTFKQVKPQAWYHSPTLAVNHDIPQNSKGLKTTIEITKEDLEEANFARVEHVTINMNAIHEKRGDMSVDLISPKGIVSHIATARKLDDSRDGYRDWDFMSVKHW